jgi:polyferredoxin
MSRWFVKGAFLAFFVASCVNLLRFAAWARGQGPYVPRPEAPAGILPVGHFTSFFAWVRGGGWDLLLPAGLVIIIGALALSLLLKRGFCAWICPIGTVWQGFAALGRKLIGKNCRPQRWLDLGLRGGRYAITAAFLFFLFSVPIAEAVGFRELPYMWVADLKTLTTMGEPLYLVIILLAGVVSMLLGPVWCRYLCPLGGLYGALGVLSPVWVQRNATTCINCRKCTKTCHAFIDVHKATDVHAPECDGCMDCVRACPVDGCLEPTIVGRRRFPYWVVPVAAVAVWLAIYGAAKATGNWDTRIPAQVFQQVINSGLLESKTPTGF